MISSETQQTCILRTTLPRYPILELVAQIGAGGHARVYLAKVPGTERIVVVKHSVDYGRHVVLPRLVQEGEMMPPSPTTPIPTRRGSASVYGDVLGSSIPAEAYHHHRLHPHPRIVPFHGHIQHPTQPQYFLLLGYVPGFAGTLSRPTRVLNSVEVRHVVLDLIEALVHCHANGIAHLDVKPSNILLGEEEHGTIRGYVSDFGVAARWEEAQRGAGTPYFMSPESLSHHVGCACNGSHGEMIPYDARKQDVWAVGVTLILALGGSMPWQRASCSPGSRYCDYVRLSPTARAGFLVAWCGLEGFMALLCASLLNPDPRERWSLEQASAWLKRVV